MTKMFSENEVKILLAKQEAKYQKIIALLELNIMSRLIRSTKAIQDVVRSTQSHEYRRLLDFSSD